MPIPNYIAALRQKVGHELILVPTVVVIIRDADGRILLVHDRDCDQWTIPGGILEPGERPADAVVREVFEETNVRVVPTKIIGVIGGESCETHYDNGDKIAWVATVFEAKVIDGSPSPDGIETKDARFVSESEIATMNIRADTIRFLRAEQESNRSPYFDPALFN